MLNIRRFFSSPWKGHRDRFISADFGSALAKSTFPHQVQEQLSSEQDRYLLVASFVNRLTVENIYRPQAFCGFNHKEDKYWRKEGWFGAFSPDSSSHTGALVVLGERVQNQFHPQSLLTRRDRTSAHTSRNPCRRRSKQPNISHQTKVRVQTWNLRKLCTYEGKYPGVTQVISKANDLVVALPASRHHQGRGRVFHRGFFYFILFFYMNGHLLEDPGTHGVSQ